MKRDTEDFVREITAQGWAVEQGRKHYKARKPGCPMVVFSLTPSSPRSVKNARADIRRAEKGGYVKGRSAGADHAANSRGPDPGLPAPPPRRTSRGRLVQASR